MSKVSAEKTAEFVRTVRDDGHGEARLYKLSEPLQGESWVVVSASSFMGLVCETYIFPSDAEGQVLDWGELDGSFQGALDHERALGNAGYRVAEGSAS